MISLARMSLQEFVSLKKEKIIWFVGLFLFLYFSNSFHIIGPIVGSILMAFEWAGKIGLGVITSLKVLFFVIDLGILYLLACLIILGYDRLSKNHPKLNEFFGLTREKYKLVGIIFAVSLIFSVVLSVLVTLVKPGIFVYTFEILSLIINLDDSTMIGGLLRGAQFTHKIPSFVISVVWWYVVSSAVLYIKNRKKSQAMG